MHPQAYNWVKRFAVNEPVDVLDIGGRDINGSVRDLFPGAASYTVLDIRPGPNVHIVADASTWEPAREWHVIVCCEVFEHTDVWPGIIRTAYKACAPGGVFILTMAGPGRPEHSAIDGAWGLKPGEYYKNVSVEELERELIDAGWDVVEVDYRQSPCDTRAVARKPRGKGNS